MAENTKKTSGIGLTIAAVVILLLGLGLGVNRLSNGIAAYQARPSTEEIAGWYEFCDLMEELEEFLSETRDLEEVDVDAVIREWLEDTRMPRWQQETFREFFEEAVELAKDGSVGRETARNHIMRERIYYRNRLTDREDAERQLRYAILFAGGCVGISALVAVPMLVTAGKKRRQAAVPDASENYDNKEF